MTVARRKGNEADRNAERPASLKRAGNFLLKMLRTEYEAKGVVVAGLSLAHALGALKDQLDRYVKKIYPFERPLGREGDPLQWWTKLDKDNSLKDEAGIPEAQPLAVGYSRTPGCRDG